MFSRNLVQEVGTSLEASGEDPAHPVRSVRDQLPSRTLRSRLGWNVSPLLNGALDFREDTVERTAFLTRGNYPTPADYATHVTAAMNSAGAPPHTIAGLTAWYRPESLNLLGDGVEMFLWNDSSGFNRQLFAGASRPLVRHNVRNGRSALRFDGAGQMLGGGVFDPVMSQLLTVGAGTVFVVFSVDLDASGADILWSQVGADVAQYYNVGTVQLVSRNNDGTQDEQVKAASLGTWTIGVWQHGGGSLFVGANDADTAALGSIASGNTATLANKLMVGSDTASHLKGYIAELIFFNVSLSEEDRRRVSRYLAQKYAIADASTAPAWTNTYAATHDAATHLFTVARTAGAATFDLYHASGKHKRESASRDLGFGTPGVVVPADSTGATSYTAPRVTYHGREWLRLDLGEDITPVQAVGLARHNILQGAGQAAVVAYAHPSPIHDPTSGGPTLTLQLTTGGGERLVGVFTQGAMNFRHWFLLVDDVSNPDGFSELGAPYIGPWLVLAKVLIGPEDDSDELSDVSFATEGEHYQTERPVRSGWNLELAVTDAERLALKEWRERVRVGRNFFFLFESDDLAGALYVYRGNALTFTGMETAPTLADPNPPQWRTKLQILEAL